MQLTQRVVPFLWVLIARVRKAEVDAFALRGAWHQVESEHMLVVEHNMHLAILVEEQLVQGVLVVLALQNGV